MVLFNLSAPPLKYECNKFALHISLLKVEHVALANVLQCKDLKTRCTIHNSTTYLDSNMSLCSRKDSLSNYVVRVYK